METKKSAVLFDAENISAQYVPSILSEVYARGDVLFLRAYADWSLQNAKAWKEQLNRTPMTALQQFHNLEQAVDKVIIMDAIELAVKHTELTEIVIVASDNGYYSLALRLRELGKKVLGIGEKSKSHSIWVKACNEFRYIEDLPKIDEDILPSDTDKVKEDEAGTDFALKKFFDQAFDATPKEESKDSVLVLTSKLGRSIQQFKSDFNYADYGATGLHDLIRKRLSSEYELSYNDDGLYFVTRKLPKTPGTKRIEGTINKIKDKYGFISNKKGNYFFDIKDVLFSGDAHLKEGVKVRFVEEKEPNQRGEGNLERNGIARTIEILAE